MLVALLMVAAVRALLAALAGAGARARAAAGDRAAEAGGEEQADEDDGARGAAADGERPDLVPDQPLEVVETALRARTGDRWGQVDEGSGDDDEARRLIALDRGLTLL